MRSKTPMIDSFVKDSKLEDGDYLNLYIQAQRIEEQLNTAKTFLSFACDRLAILARTNNDYILVDRIKRIVKGTEWTK